MRQAGAETLGWEVLFELERAEVRIRAQLRTEDPAPLPVDVSLIDYAMDQLRFFMAASRTLKADGLSDVRALEQAELLSLPECLRKAKTKRTRERVLTYALSGEWLCWQRAVDPKRPLSLPGMLPRQHDWPAPTIQLSPYPSDVRLRPRDLVTLEAEVLTNPALDPSPLHPMRKLKPGLTWSLQLVFWRGGREVRILIDPPWEFHLSDAQSGLNVQAERLEHLADLAGC